MSYFTDTLTNSGPGKDFIAADVFVSGPVALADDSSIGTKLVCTASVSIRHAQGG